MELNLLRRKGPTNQVFPPQRVAAAGFPGGLKYFGQSLHGVLDVNGDGLVDLAVGALGAAVIIWLDHSQPMDPGEAGLFSWVLSRPQVSQGGADPGRAALPAPEGQRLQQGLSAGGEGGVLHVPQRLPGPALDQQQRHGNGGSG